MACPPESTMPWPATSARTWRAVTASKARLTRRGRSLQGRGSCVQMPARIPTEAQHASEPEAALWLTSTMAGAEYRRRR